MYDHAIMNYLNVLEKFEYTFFFPTKSARTKVVSVNQFFKLQMPLLKEPK